MRHRLLFPYRRRVRPLALSYPMRTHRTFPASAWKLSSGSSIWGAPRTPSHLVRRAPHGPHPTHPHEPFCDRHPKAAPHRLPSLHRRHQPRGVHNASVNCAHLVVARQCVLKALGSHISSRKRKHAPTLTRPPRHSTVSMMSAMIVIWAFGESNGATQSAQF